jgi:hypothetical protein
VGVRKKAVDDGRAFIRVTHAATGAPATAAVCPACWNLQERRAALLAQLSRRGLAVVHMEDAADGVFRQGSRHAPGCGYAGMTADGVERTRRAASKGEG